MTPHPVFSAAPAMVASWSVAPSTASTSEHRDVGLLDRAARDEDADGLHGAGTRHPTGTADPCRVEDPERPLVPLQDRVHGVARRPGHVADDRPLFFQQPVHQRRLADVRAPDDRHLGLRLRGRRRRLVLQFGEPRDDLVEQVADALAVLRRNLDDRLEPEGVELDRPTASVPIVRLVDRDQHRPAHRAERAGDLLVPGHQPFAPIYNEDNEIRRQMARRPCSTTSSCSGSRLAPNMPPVSTTENLAPCHSAGCAMVSRVVPATRRHDGAPRVGNAVEQGRLSHVGTADQHNRRGGAGAFHRHLKVQLGASLTA